METLTRAISIRPSRGMAKGFIPWLTGRGSQVMSTMAVGRRMPGMEKRASVFTIMKNFILEIGSMIRGMDKETIFTSLKRDTSVNGDMI